ncbi:MAG: hypothetical protein ABSA02_11145 [Trebonia sp.]
MARLSDGAFDGCPGAGRLLAAGAQPGEGHVRRAVLVPRQIGVDAADAADGNASWPGRVATLPICVQLAKSVLR